MTDLRHCGGAEQDEEIRRIVESYRPDHGRCKKVSDALGRLRQVSGIVHDWIGLAEVSRIYTDEEGSDWIFRGQTFPHPLMPKIGREGARKDPSTDSPLPYSAHDEQWIATEFSRRAQPYLNHTPQGCLEWLAIAQHHGMPTRLLDWTESFLVASYFAVERAGTNGPAIVYATRGERERMSVDDPSTLAEVRLYRPPHIAPRIPAQQALFTVHPDPTVAYTPPDLQCWVIKSGACYNIKKQLHLCGINISVLFPDIDGLARYLEWLYKRPTSTRRVGR